MNRDGFFSVEFDPDQFEPARHVPWIQASPFDHRPVTLGR